MNAIMHILAEESSPPAKTSFTEPVQGIDPRTELALRPVAGTQKRLGVLPGHCVCLALLLHFMIGGMVFASARYALLNSGLAASGSGSAGELTALGWVSLGQAGGGMAANPSVPAEAPGMETSGETREADKTDTTLLRRTATEPVPEAGASSRPPKEPEERLLKEHAIPVKALPKALPLPSDALQADPRFAASSPSPKKRQNSEKTALATNSGKKRPSPPSFSRPPAEFSTGTGERPAVGGTSAESDSSGTSAGKTNAAAKGTGENTRGSGENAKGTGESAQESEAAGGAPGVAGGTGDVPFGGKNGPAFKDFVKPEYPAQARRQGIAGEVLLRILVSADGRVEQVEVRRSAHEALSRAAREAVLRSTFHPLRRNGTPAPCWTLLPVTFSLERV